MKILNFYFSDVLSILSKHHKYKLFLFILLFILGTIFETIGIGFIIPVIETISNYDNFKIKLESLNLFSFDGFNKESVILIVVGLLLIIYTTKSIFLTILSYLQFKFLKEIKYELGNIAFKSYIQKNFILHLRVIKSISKKFFYKSEQVKRKKIKNNPRSEKFDY